MVKKTDRKKTAARPRVVREASASWAELSPDMVIQAILTRAAGDGTMTPGILAQVRTELGKAHKRNGLAWLLVSKAFEAGWDSSESTRRAMEGLLGQKLRRDLADEGDAGNRLMRALGAQVREEQYPPPGQAVCPHGAVDGDRACGGPRMNHFPGWWRCGRCDGTAAPAAGDTRTILRHSSKPPAAGDGSMPSVLQKHGPGSERWVDQTFDGAQWADDFPRVDFEVRGGFDEPGE